MKRFAKRALIVASMSPFIGFILSVALASLLPYESRISRLSAALLSGPLSRLAELDRQRGGHVIFENPVNSFAVLVIYWVALGEILYFILTFCPTSSGIIEHGPNEIWQFARLIGFSLSLVAELLALVALCFSGLCLLSRPNPRALRWVALSSLISIEAFICCAFWLKSGAFPRV